MADSIEEVVYDYLIADTSFTSDFSGVFFLESTTETYPYIVFWLVDDNGVKTVLGKAEQGEARIQFDLWDNNKMRGVKLRTALREKINSLNESRGGYVVTVTGITEQTVPRQSASDPFHFVVDGIVKWQEG